MYYEPVTFIILFIAIQWAFVSVLYNAYKSCRYSRGQSIGRIRRLSTWIITLSIITILFMMMNAFSYLLVASKGKDSSVFDVTLNGSYFTMIAIYLLLLYLYFVFTTESKNITHPTTKKFIYKLLATIGVVLVFCALVTDFIATIEVGMVSITVAVGVLSLTILYIIRTQIENLAFELNYAASQAGFTQHATAQFELISEGYTSPQAGAVNKGASDITPRGPRIKRARHEHELKQTFTPANSNLIDATDLTPETINNTKNSKNSKSGKKNSKNSKNSKNGKNAKNKQEVIGNTKGNNDIVTTTATTTEKKNNDDDGDYLDVDEIDEDDGNIRVVAGIDFTRMESADGVGNDGGGQLNDSGIVGIGKNDEEAIDYNADNYENYKTTIIFVYGLVTLLLGLIGLYLSIIFYEIMNLESRELNSEYFENENNDSDSDNDIEYDSRYDYGKSYLYILICIVFSINVLVIFESLYLFFGLNRNNVGYGSELARKYFFEKRICWNKISCMFIKQGCVEKYVKKYVIQKTRRNSSVNLNNNNDNINGNNNTTTNNNNNNNIGGNSIELRANVAELSIRYV